MSELRCGVAPPIRALIFVLRFAASLCHFLVGFFPYISIPYVVAQNSSLFRVVDTR